MEGRGLLRALAYLSRSPGSAPCCLPFSPVFPSTTARLLRQADARLTADTPQRLTRKHNLAPRTGPIASASGRSPPRPASARTSPSSTYLPKRALNLRVSAFELWRALNVSALLTVSPLVLLPSSPMVKLLHHAFSSARHDALFEIKPVGHSTRTVRLRRCSRGTPRYPYMAAVFVILPADLPLPPTPSPNLSP